MTVAVFRNGPLVGKTEVLRTQRCVGAVTGIVDVSVFVHREGHWLEVDEALPEMVQT